MSRPDDERCRHKPEIGAADDARIVLGLEPARAQLDAPRRQPGEAPLELGAARAVARHENHEIREAAARRGGLPAANALLEPRHRVDDDVEVFVLGPARRAHDEADAPAVDAEAREQRLTEPFALDALHRHERGRRPIVEHVRVACTPNRLSRNAASPRDTQRFASTRRASRRSNQRASRTAGCHAPSRRRSSV